MAQFPASGPPHSESPSSGPSRKAPKKVPAAPVPGSELPPGVHQVIVIAAPPGGGEPQQEEMKSDEGFFLRGAVEYSSIVVPRRYLVISEGPGYHIELEEGGRSDAKAWGGRIEIGYASEKAAHVGVLPRFGMSLAALEEEKYSRDVFDKELVFVSQPWWWSIGVGVEVQFPYRFLGISAEIGWGAIFSDHVAKGPDSLEVIERARTGPAGRVAAVFRIPIPGPAGLGITAAAEGFGVPGASNIWGTKTSFGAFVEWDGSR